MSHIGIQASRTAAKSSVISLPNVPGLAMLVVAADAASGSGYGSVFNEFGPQSFLSPPSITGTTSQTLSTTSANPSITWGAEMPGQYIRITGAANAQNNGTFLITSRSGTNITYANPTPGVAEAGAPVTVYIYPRIQSLTCRVTGQTFTNGTLTNLPPMLPFVGTDRPYRAARGTVATSLVNASTTIAGLFNGNTLCSMGVYFSAAGASAPDYFSFTDSVSTYANAIRYRHNFSTSAQQMVRTQASAATTVSSPGTGMSAPTLVGLCYRPGIGTDHMISEGPLVPGPLDLDNGTVSNGTERTVGSMSNTVLMGTVSGGSGSSVLGWVAGTQRWTITQWATIRQWFDTYFYPYP